MADDFGKQLLTTLDSLNRNVNELNWANIFHDSIKGCTWLDSENFAINPGRWAVGYNYFYAVFRVLNEFKPKNILELGLGQSSRLIGQYAKTHEDCRHSIVEHDAAFVEISRKNFNFAPNTEINVVGLKRITLNLSDGKGGTGEVTIYDEEHFSEVVEGQRYDFISIDGPYGFNNALPFSRIDILNYLPQCLNESFCLVIDDFNRIGEKNTAALIKNILAQENIPFREGVYSGSKDLYLLASANLAWLCTM